MHKCKAWDYKNLSRKYEKQAPFLGFVNDFKDITLKYRQQKQIYISGNTISDWKVSAQ